MKGDKYGWKGGREEMDERREVWKERKERGREEMEVEKDGRRRNGGERRWKERRGTGRR